MSFRHLVENSNITGTLHNLPALSVIGKFVHNGYESGHNINVINVYNECKRSENRFLWGAGVHVGPVGDFDVQDSPLLSAIKPGP